MINNSFRKYLVRIILYKVLYLYNNMTEFICQNCSKKFIHKSSYTKHLNRKFPCVKNTSPVNINTIIKKKKSSPKSKSNTNLLRFMDLFCGIGGFHSAFDKLPISTQCVMACDIDKRCGILYKKNYNIDIEHDITKLDPNSLADTDIICGGFPCQPFSNAGKKKMMSDDRGLLFDEIIRLAMVKQPKFMFLENVKHIRKVGNGEVFQYILDTLDKNGYIVQTFTISPHEYGIPQQRERVYFVCVRKDIYNNKEIVLPEKTDYHNINLEEFLENPEEIDNKYFINGDILKSLELWDEMIQHFDIDEKISPTIMINEAYNNHTPEDFENYAGWRKDYITKNKPLIEKYQPQFDSWYQKHQDILTRREIYGKLEWQVGPIKPNDSIFNYFIQLRQSGIRVKKPHYFPTLVAINQTPIYGKEKRYITPRECARLQSFPENFILDEDDNKSYKQFGNSVNVDNVYMVIYTTLKHYNMVE